MRAALAQSPHRRLLPRILAHLSSPVFSTFAPRNPTILYARAISMLRSTALRRPRRPQRKQPSSPLRCCLRRRPCDEVRARKLAARAHFWPAHPTIRPPFAAALGANFARCSGGGCGGGYGRDSGEDTEERSKTATPLHIAGRIPKRFAEPATHPLLAQRGSLLSLHTRGTHSDSRKRARSAGTGSRRPRERTEGRKSERKFAELKGKRGRQKERDERRGREANEHTMEARMRAGVLSG
mmetsp:Transcript_14995/g.40219  ORF Transcript_14995/g.40219 Transcript_14995/m.40219 type:complete len:239 (+) Transcript_14995:557-1273(+)